jgi:hypothetical protein
MAARAQLGSDRSLRPWRLGLAVVLVLAVSSVARPARAEPQANVSLTFGGAGVGSEGQFWDHAEVHLGVRSDVLFGHESATDFGVGPYVELGTFAFDDLHFGGGASLLLPVAEDFPLVASFGPYGRWADDDFGLEGGLGGSLFWGTRSYNFHANYVMAGGLLVGFRESLGPSHESMLVIALQADLAFIGLPLVGLIDLMRGPSGETAPVTPSEPGP